MEQCTDLPLHRLLTADQSKAEGAAQHAVSCEASSESLQLSLGVSSKKCRPSIWQLTSLRPNYAWSPSNHIKDLAHFLIDECGVDIIHGHSSHHVQGVETYKGKLIIYGCGDFVDDYALTPGYRNDLSGIWQVKVGESSEFEGLRLKSLTVFSTKIDRFMARRLASDEADSRWVRRKITELSAELGTDVGRISDREGQLVFDLTD